MNDSEVESGEMRARTRGTAFAVLLEEFRAARRGLGDQDPGKGILSEELLREVFRSAWKHQFDDDRSSFRAEVREIVEDAVQVDELDGSSEGGKG